MSKICDASRENALSGTSADSAAQNKHAYPRCLIEKLPYPLRDCADARADQELHFPHISFNSALKGLTVINVYKSWCLYACLYIGHLVHDN